MTSQMGACGAPTTPLGALSEVFNAEWLNIGCDLLPGI